MPYVRKNGTWPHGEEWLYEVIIDSYLPLLNMIHKLKNKLNHPFLTINLTPVLIEQLNDPYIIEKLKEFIRFKISLIERDKQIFPPALNGLGKELAHYYQEIHYSRLQDFEQKYQSNLIKAFSELQKEGKIEIMASAATHGYLPLIKKEASIYSQLKIGIEIYKKNFNQKPKGFWLPECAYQPEKEIENFLSKLGIKYIIVDSAAFGSDKSTFLPYKISNSSVIALGRNKVLCNQIVSPDIGYPSDRNYREFFKRAEYSGIYYWKVDDKMMPLNDKGFYQIEEAQKKAQEHARHFARQLKKELINFKKENKTPGLVLVALDTEFLGHHWYEGISWLEHLLILLKKQKEINITSPNFMLKEIKNTKKIKLRESSWEEHGSHSTWLNSETAWLWGIIYMAERVMEQTINDIGRIDKTRIRIINQAFRELMLLQSSDWPFQISKKHSLEYPLERFKAHAYRFSNLIDGISHLKLTPSYLSFLETLEEKDNIFKDLDYLIFKEGMGIKGAKK